MKAMSIQVSEWIEVISLGISIFGVSILVLGIALATWRFGGRHVQKVDDDNVRAYKIELGRVLLLGLEILVAADIVETVATEPSFTSVGVLALLVLVRTFLSWTLVLEIEGRWPWQPVSETSIPPAK